MTLRSLTLAFGLVLTPLAACAATQPATQPASTQPAATQPARVTPEVSHWLDRLSARAKQLHTLKAAVRYDRVQVLEGDEQIRFGTLLYDAGPPARFNLDFKRMVVNGGVQPREHRFVFDGHWLAETDAEHKTFVRRELVPAHEKGHDLLRLGKGPFALPLDLDKATVLQRFDVTLVAPDKNDPANTVHLRLTPRPHTDVKQSRIDLWYDRKTLLPVRVRTANDDAQTESTILLSHVQTGMKLPKDAFETQPPRARNGWQIDIKPLKDAKG